jgi:hypothetical protein
MRFQSATAAARDRLPPLPLCVVPLAPGRLYCGREASPGAGPKLCCVFEPVAALFAAHLAFIAAANCARRSGVRLSFLFALLAAPDPFPVAAGFTPAFFLSLDAEALPAFLARAADLLFGLATARVSAAPSFCFSLASFCSPFFKRASSRRIFFVRLLTFFIWDEESLHRPVIGMLT